MQAITRGWVVQVTPVHERSSPRAAWFCFEFCTVTGGGGATADEQLGLACAWPWGSSAASQAAGETRCGFRFRQLTSSEGSGVSQALGTGEGSRLAFGGQESGGICGLRQHS